MLVDHQRFRIMNAPLATPAGTRTFDVHGMTCAACSSRIEKVLSSTPGVISARVNLALERADVELAPGVSDETVIEAVDRAGYEAQPRAADPAERRRQQEAEEAERRGFYRRTLALFVVSALLTAPFIVQMIVMTAGGGHLLTPGRSSSSRRSSRSRPARGSIAERSRHCGAGPPTWTSWSRSERRPPSSIRPSSSSRRGTMRQAISISRRRRRSSPWCSPASSWRRGPRRARRPRCGH